VTQERWPDAFEQVRHVLAERLAAQPLLGAQLFVSRHGVPLLDAAIGAAQPGRPMARDSVLFWSCAGKPLIALAVALLVDEGALGFDDPVSRHLPEFGAGGKNGITIGDVLTHSGGFRHIPGPGPYYERYETFIERVNATPLEPGWVPGRDQGYHQETGWYVLAALVEAKRAHGYPDDVMERICRPVGMDSTWVTMSAEVHDSVRPRLAVPSYVSRRGVRRVPYLISAPGCRTRIPSYGCYGTMADLGRFYEQLLLGLDGQGSSPVSRGTLALMTGRGRGPTFDRTWKHECEYAHGFSRDVSRHWGFGSGWSESSFGMVGLVGHVCGGGDPATGIVIAASFGALAHGQKDLEALMSSVYAGALS
jgi:CubicO group peptidase (beta-lactamase class C family)